VVQAAQAEQALTVLAAAVVEGIGDGSPLTLIPLVFSIGSFLIVALGLGFIRLAWSQVREARADIKTLQGTYAGLLQLWNDIDKRKLSIPAAPLPPFRPRSRSRPNIE
jgi:hypothetical protein